MDDVTLVRLGFGERDYSFGIDQDGELFEAWYAPRIRSGANATSVIGLTKAEAARAAWDDYRTRPEGADALPLS